MPAGPQLPEGPTWSYEIKLDGYRLEVMKSAGKITLYSRRRNVLNTKFSYIADALGALPDGTVLDGEIVAMDADGKSDFNLLQNFRSAELKIRYYAFDVLMHKGQLLTSKPNVGKKLMFAARVRAGFVPATRREVFAQIKDLKTSTCPFANLPEASEGRWGQGLTLDKMKGCVWLKPQAVVRIDFAEWTGADKLRHTKFVAIREDKDPRKVLRET